MVIVLDLFWDWFDVDVSLYVSSNNLSTHLEYLMLLLGLDCVDYDLIWPLIFLLFPQTMSLSTHHEYLMLVLN